MGISFAYPEYLPHVPYRVLTRDQDMVLRHILRADVDQGIVLRNGVVFHKPKNVPAHVVFPSGTPSFISNQEGIDSYFMSHGGINLCNWYIYHNRGIRSGGIRLRNDVHPEHSSVAQAFEPLCFGVGVFRPAGTRQEGGLDCVLGNPALPKVNSRYIGILLSQIVPYGLKEDARIPWMVAKEVYETTNLILADSYGELEQLLRRKNDEKFLEAYLNDMRDTAEIIELKLMTPQGLTTIAGPRGMATLNEHVIAAWMNHIKCGIWSGPPSGIPELMERVVFLLENTVVDKKATGWVTSHNHLNLFPKASCDPMGSRHKL